MFKVRFISILHELVTFSPYWFVILLHSNINFHVLITSFHNHDLLMGVRFFFQWWIGWFWTQWVPNVDDSVHIFTCCDNRTGCGNMLAKCIDRCSLMNYSLVTTLGKGFLDCSATTLFFSFSWIGCGFEESTCVSSFD